MHILSILGFFHVLAILQILSFLAILSILNSFYSVAILHILSFISFPGESANPPASFGSSGSCISDSSSAS